MSCTQRSTLGHCLLLLVSATSCSDVGTRSSDPAPAGITQEIRIAFSQGSRVARMLRLAPPLDRLGPENLKAVLAAYDEYMVGLWPSEIHLLMDAWTRFDGPGAFEFARSVGFEGKRPEALEAALFGWALHDPVAAQAAVEAAIERGGLGRRMLVPVVRGWVESGQPGFEALLRAEPLPKALIDVALREVFRIRGVEGLLSETERLINSDADAERRAHIFAKSLDIASLVDIMQAKRWLEEHRDDVFARSGPGLVAGRWALTAPEETLEWLRSMPAASRDDGVRRTFRVWSANDPRAAIAWLETRPAEPFLDPAYLVIAQTLDPTSSEEALDWCGRISAAHMGTRCLVTVAGRWYGREPAAAEAWLADSSLDPEAQRKIRAGARKRRPKAR